MAEPVKEATIRCPHCGAETPENTPTDACVRFWECPACRALLKPKPGVCCVFCSYGTIPCPPTGLNSGCVALAFGLSMKAFHPFLPDDGHHGERGDGIGPPPAEGRVEPYTGEGNHREIGAERGLRRIGLEAPLPRAWATRRLARARTGMTTTERARITTPDRLRSGCSRCQGSCSVAPHPMIPAPTIPRRPTCSCSRTRHLADAASEPKPQGEIAHAGSGSLPAELRALRESRGGYERVPEHSACTQSAHIGFPHRLSQGCICC